MTAADIAQLHGITRNDMMKNEMDAYVRPTTGGDIRFVGVTEAEKTLSPSFEYAEFYRGQPQVLFASRISKVDINMKFAFKQFDPSILGLALNGEVDRSDPNTDVVYLGTEPGAPLECNWWFIGELYDKRPIQFCFRVGIIQSPEDITTGTADWASIPVTLRALPDDEICDKQRNLMYICIGKLDVPTGGFIDPCESEYATPCEPD